MNEEDKKLRGESEAETAFFDGDCPMCRAFVPHFEGSEKESVDFKNLRQSDLPDSITLEQATREIHLKKKDGEVIKGAEAVFFIMKKNKKFAWLAHLGSLPGIGWLSQLIYLWFASNRFLIFGPLQRLFWSKITISLALIIPLIVTRNLWLGDYFRDYPLTPVSRFLPVIPFPLDVIALGAMLLLLVAMLITPFSKRIIQSFLVLSLLYSIFDQSRWLPYYYQYWFMLLALSLIDWKKPKNTFNKETVLAIFGIILISIWFWSGLHKISFRYWFMGFPWMMSPFTSGLSPEISAQINLLAFTSTPVESGGALLLLWKKTRHAGVVLLTAMHLVILTIFGPFGLDINHSVWSWNVAQIIMLWCVFWKNPELSARMLILGKSILHKAIMVPFLIMPIFNDFGIWDDFLSHALYSWSTKEAEILVKNPRTEAELPERARRALDTNQRGERFIHILDWTYIEFESPPYHSFRVFKQVMRSVCNSVEHKEDLELIIYDKPPSFSTVSKKHYFSCESVSS